MAKKEKILIVGQNPKLFTGNGNMLQACIDQIDKSKYDICAFLKGEAPMEISPDPFTEDFSFDFNFIQAEANNDPWGKQKLVDLIYLFDFDQLIFIGIDIWRYSETFQTIKKIQNTKNFQWKVIVPYDLPYMRDDWLEWYKYPDMVFVYSEYAFQELWMLEPNIEYFRPPLRFQELFTRPKKAEKKEIRKQLFPDIDENTAVFGFIGANQARKNILRLMWGFSKAVKRREEQFGKTDMLLYMHMDNVNGPIFNIERLVHDFELPDAVVRHNGKSRRLFPEEIATVYKTFDAHLLPSLQEGLSWTVIETNLTGVPSLISANTAHLDYIDYTNDPRDIGIIPIEMDDTCNLPLMTASGATNIAAQACSPDAICEAILEFMNIKDAEKDEILSKNAREFGVDWCDNCSHISQVLETSVERKESVKPEFGELL